MTGIEQQFLGSFIGAVGTLAAVLVAVNKLKAGFKKEIDEKIESEIKNARNVAESDLRAVDAKLDSLSRDIGNLEDKMDRDISNVKAIYNSEIKNLSEKIESLRDDVQRQHQQLVGLLTKLVAND
jgi:peptidoglycan hydrolase CwlO-like protein